MACLSLGNKLGNKIVAVGRNYAAHAKELGSDIPKEPILFLKPTSSYVCEPEPIEVPRGVDSVDHEVELAVVMGKTAKNVTEKQAMGYVRGYALALDMTARKLQNDAKAKGLPWTVSKGYDTFTPISDLLPKSRIHLQNSELWLKVDGELKQKGKVGDMIFTVPFLVQYISSIMTLHEGDVILTGTPPGVGPVAPGQTITAGISKLIQIRFPVIRRPDSSDPFKHCASSLDGSEVAS